MIYGIFLDSRMWSLDFISSPFFHELRDNQGVCIDLLHDLKNIERVDKKYKFVIATEVWDVNMQKALGILRNKGLKVFLVSRELTPTKAHIASMFNFQSFLFNGQYYFSPDCVFAVSQDYADLWAGKTKTEVIGYPRFDIYLREDLWKTKKQVCDRFSLRHDKRILFFPSYPPYHVQTVNGVNVNHDLYDDLSDTMKCFEDVVSVRNDIQVVVKIHPMSQKCYDKKIGTGKEVAGLLEKYLKNPTDKIKVIPDIRNDSSVSRDMATIADFIVGYASTMMLEGVILKKPVLFVELPQAQNVKDGIEYGKYMKSVKSYDELAVSLKNMFADPEPYRVKDQNIVSKYLYCVDGKFFERLASSIKSNL